MSECNCHEVAKLLKGMVVTGEVYTDEDQPDSAGWQKLIFMDRTTGKKYHIEPSRDPEGNAPGFLFFGSE
jgi:hypothetical protein